MKFCSLRSLNRRGLAAAALAVGLAAAGLVLDPVGASAHGGSDHGGSHSQLPGVDDHGRIDPNAVPLESQRDVFGPMVAGAPTFDFFYKRVDGEFLQPFSESVAATGPAESGPITYSITNGSLPSGLELDTATGEISGIPTVSVYEWVEVTATNNDGSAAAWVVFEIAGRPVFESFNIFGPNAIPGEPYVFAVQAAASPAAGEIVYSVREGYELPAGLTLDPVTGVISGTPTTSSRVVTEIFATNAAGSDSTIVIIDVIGYPAWDDGLVEQRRLAEVQSGEPVSAHILAVSPFGQPVTYSAPDGLPLGLSLNPVTGAITGTPINGGLLRFVVQATNALGFDTLEVEILVDRLPDPRTPDSITVAPVAEQSTSTAPFTIPAPTATSTLPVTYVVRRPTVCTYDGTTITIVGAGRCVIDFSTAGDATYRPAIAFVNFNVTPSTPQKGGPVVLGGDDAPDHGEVLLPAFDTGSAADESTTFIEGWRYVMLAVRAVYENSYRPGNDGSIALLGSADPGADYMTLESNTGALVKMLADRLGFTVHFYPTPTDIAGFFSDLASNTAKPAMIYIAGQGAANDFFENGVAGSDLAPFADDIAAFVNSGGALLSHGDEHYPDWLSTVFPGLDVSFENDNEIINLTPDGNTLFPGLVDRDLASPWHAHFIGDLKFLKVLGLGEDVYLNEEGNRQQVLIGGIRAVFPAGLIGEGPADPVARAATATVSATLTVNGNPVVGSTITFTVSSGPNLGAVRTAVTNASGVATVTFTYPNGGTGDQDTVDITTTYNSADYTDQVHVDWAPLPNVISFDPPTTMVVGDTWPLVGTASSGLTVTFSASGQCVIVDGVLRATGRGECVVTAYQPGGGDVPPATPAVRIITVTPKPVTVEWKGFTLTPLPGDDSQLFMRATTDPFMAGCTVVFTLTPDLGTPNGPYEAITYTTAGAKAGPIRMSPGVYDVDLTATGDCAGQGPADLQIEVPGSLPETGGGDPTPLVITALSLLAVGGVLVRRRRTVTV